MSFATTINIAAILLCIAVLVQSIRLMRALDTIKAGGLAPMVASLEIATAEARRVLGHLSELMRGDMAMTAQTLSAGKAMVDELAVMTGIGNAIAERIVEAAAAVRRPELPAHDSIPAPKDVAPLATRPAPVRASKPVAGRPAKVAAAAAAVLPPADQMPPGSIAAAARTARRLRVRLAAVQPAPDAGSASESLAA